MAAKKAKSTKKSSTKTKTKSVKTTQKSVKKSVPKKVAVANKSPEKNTTIYKNYIIVLLVGLLILLLGYVANLIGDSTRTEEQIYKEDITLIIRGDVELFKDKVAITEPVIEWVGEKEDKKAGVMSVASLITYWDSIEEKSKPIAILPSSEMKLAITNPAIGVDFNSLIFDYSRINGDHEPGKLGNTSLLLNNYPISFNDQLLEYNKNTDNQSYYRISCHEELHGFDYLFEAVIERTDVKYEQTDCEYWDQFLLDLANTTIGVQNNGYIITNQTLNRGYFYNVSYECKGSYKQGIESGSYRIVNSLCFPVESSDEDGSRYPQINISSWII